MQNIMFIRHGESVINVNRIVSHDVGVFPLTEKGREQATIVGAQLKGISVKTVYCSPMLRAKETADIIAKALGCGITVDNRLRERHMGELNNKSIEGLGDLRSVMIKNGFKGLENWKSLNDRVFEFLAEKREENIIAVTHHDPVKVAVAHAMGLLDEISAWGITISNASLSIINKESKYRVIAFAIPPLDCMLKEAISRIPGRN